MCSHPRASKRVVLVPQSPGETLQFVPEDPVPSLHDTSSAESPISATQVEPPVSGAVRRLDWVCNSQDVRSTVPVTGLTTLDTESDAESENSPPPLPPPPPSTPITKDCGGKSRTFCPRVCQILSAVSPTLTNLPGTDAVQRSLWRIAVDIRRASTRHSCLLSRIWTTDVRQPGSDDENSSLLLEGRVQSSSAHLSGGNRLRVGPH